MKLERKLKVNTSMSRTTQPFVPSQPEKTVRVEITEREAVLLTKLRKFPYGKILVHKSEGIIIRIEPTNSILIKPEKEDIDLT